MIISQKYLPWQATYPKYGREDTYATLASLQHEKIAVLDTETTGLKKTDQITEIAIVDYHTQEVLLHTLLLPKGIDTSFSESKAAKVSGLSYDQLLLQPTFQDIFSTVEPLLKSYIIAGWNVEFDAKMLVRSAAYYHLPLPRFKTLDIMKLFQAFTAFSDWNTLEEALAICEIEKPGDMHRALSDVRSTRSVLQWMEQAASKERSA